MNQDNFDKDLNNVGEINFKDEEQSKKDDNQSQNQVSQKDSQFQNDAEEEAYKSKSCIEKLKYRCINLKLQLLNYLQFDQVFDNETDSTNIQQMKKVQKYYQNGIKKRYGENFSQSYTQREKSFGYTFDQVLQQRQRQFQRKQKTFWGELKRMICCQGGNQMEDLEDINPHYYKLKARKKLSAKSSSNQIPIIESQGFIQTNLMKVQQKNSDLQTKQMKDQTQQNIFQKQKFHDIFQEQAGKNKKNLKQNQEKKIKVDLDDPNYAGRRPGNKRAKKIAVEDRIEQDDDVLNTAAHNQYNYVQTNKERRTDIGHLTNNRNESQRMKHNQSNLVQSSKEKTHHNQFDDHNQQNQNKNQNHYLNNKNLQKPNGNVYQRHYNEGSESNNRNKQMKNGHQQRIQNRDQRAQNRDGSINQGLSNNQYQQGRGGIKNKQFGEGLVSNNQGLTNSQYLKGADSSKNKQVTQHGDPQLLVSEQSNIRKPKQRKRKAQANKNNQNRQQMFNNDEKNNDSGLINNQSNILFNDNAIEQQNLESIEMQSSKKQVGSKRKSKKQKQEHGIQQIANHAQQGNQIIPINKYYSNDKPYNTVNIAEQIGNRRYQHGDGTFDRKQQNQLSIKKMQQNAIKKYETEQIEQAGSQIKKARKSKKNKPKISNQGDEQDINMQQQNPSKKNMSQSVAVKTRKKKTANHLIVNDLEDVQQIELDQVITFDNNELQKQVNQKYNSEKIGAQHLNYRKIVQDDESKFQPYKMKANDYNNGQLKNFIGHQESLTHKNDPHKTGVNYSYARKNTDGQELVQNKTIMLPKDQCEKVQKHKAEKKRRKNKKQKVSQIKGQEQVYDLEQI